MADGQVWQIIQWKEEVGGINKMWLHNEIKNFTVWFQTRESGHVYMQKVRRNQ